MRNIVWRKFCFNWLKFFYSGMVLIVWCFLFSIWSSLVLLILIMFIIFWGWSSWKR